MVAAASSARRLGTPCPFSHARCEARKGRPFLKRQGLEDHRHRALLRNIGLTVTYAGVDMRASHPGPASSLPEPALTKCSMMTRYLYDSSPRPRRRRSREETGASVATQSFEGDYRPSSEAPLVARLGAGGPAADRVPHAAGQYPQYHPRSADPDASHRRPGARRHRLQDLRHPAAE